MKPHINATLEQLYQTTELWFTDKLVDFSEHVTDMLVRKSEQSTITSVQAQCFTAIHSIRNTGSRSISRFTESLKKNFQTDTINPSLNDDLYSITHKPKNKLDLLTTKDLEDSLSYETAIEKLQKRHKEAFAYLEVRIYELLKQNRESIANNPVSAETIISAFREALDLFDFAAEIRIEVYELFEQFMDSHLAELLEALNEQLINEGILTDIDQDYFIKKLARKNHSPSSHSEMQDPSASEQTELTENPYAPPPADDQFQAAGAAPTLPQNYITGAAPGANPGINPNYNPNPNQPQVQPNQGTGEHDLHSRLMDLANRLSGNSIPTGSAADTNQLTGQPFQTTAQQNINNDMPADSVRFNANPASSLLNKLSNKLSSGTQTLNQTWSANNSSSQISSLLGYGLSRQYASANNSFQTLKDIYIKAQNKGISGMLTSSYKNQYNVSTDELVQAIIDVKNSTPDYQPDHATDSIAQKIREQVLSGVNKSAEKTELKNKKLFLIDIIETLFDHICNNKDLTPTASHLFRRLTIPVIHLALIDDTFIDNNQHPARLFLDDFADAALGISDNEDSQNNPLYLKLHKITELASQEDHINSAFFSQLHADLKRFIQYRKQQANIKSPSSRKQIEKKIDAIILYFSQNQEVPENLLLILSKVWKKVMLNIWFDDNYNEDDWEKSKAFIGTLIKSIKAAKTDIDIKRLKRLYPVLRQEFEDGLIQINLPFEQKIKLLKYLDMLHKNSLPARHTQLEPTNKQSGHISEHTVSETIPASGEPADQEINNASIKEVVEQAEQLEENTSKLHNTGQNEVIELITADDLREAENNNNSSYSRKLSVTDYDLIRLATQAYKLTAVANDRYTEMVRQLEVEDWIEFRFEAHFSRAKITWISDDKTQFNCLTQNNHVVEMTVDVLSHCFRNNIATMITHHSVIENAIHETASDLIPPSH